MMFGISTLYSSDPAIKQYIKHLDETERLGKRYRSFICVIVTSMHEVSKHLEDGKEVQFLLLFSGPPVVGRSSYSVYLHSYTSS